MSVLVLSGGALPALDPRAPVPPGGVVPTRREGYGTPERIAPSTVQAVVARTPPLPQGLPLRPDLTWHQPPRH